MRAIIGWTRNSRNEPTKIVTMNGTAVDRALRSPFTTVVATSSPQVAAPMGSLETAQRK
jgi:hypothetical protein